MTDVAVSLAEVLEVRNSALYEEEILALFVQALPPIQILTDQARTSDIIDCVFSPDSFFLYSDGLVKVKLVHRDGVTLDFLPPESSPSNLPLLFVYCLGTVLLHALNYNDNSAHRSAGADLVSLLNVMTVADVHTRPSLVRLVQIGRQKVLDRNINVGKTIGNLHQVVMGNEMLSDEEQDSNEIAHVTSELNAITDDDHNDREIATDSMCTFVDDLGIIGSPIGNSTKLDVANELQLVTAVCDVGQSIFDHHSTGHSAHLTGQMTDDNNVDDRLAANFGDTANLPHKKRTVLTNIDTMLGVGKCQDVPLLNDNIVLDEADDDRQGHLLDQHNGDVVFQFVDGTKSTPLPEQYAETVEKNSTNHTKQGEIHREGVETDEISVEKDVKSVEKDVKSVENSVNNFNDDVKKSVKKALESALELPDAIVCPIAGTAHFVRQDSLASYRISGRTPSKRKPFKTVPMNGPEFLYKSRLPSIRLKASSYRKRNPILRSEINSDVQVVLLCGQKVEVSCHTNSTVSDIFHLVVVHTNLSEHYFFGLTVLKDGEHFFLEPHQRLCKFAPADWKHHQKSSVKILFSLFLRLKYYPHSMDFIKTDLTAHEIYLQLRHDLIDERLHSDRDSAFQLAALALQAEMGDRPADNNAYFQPEHYLPQQHLHEHLGGDERIRLLLAELHSQYSGMSRKDAEMEFLKMCQSQREYGIHFHRVFRSKPSLNLGNTPLGDPETGTALWIGIMPRGVVVFEETRGYRSVLSQHPWHRTETLQFDKKKFVIVAGDEEEKTSSRTVFFTDDYKKSSYFVKFAAAQHRFMMKLRHWTATLQVQMRADQRRSTDFPADSALGEVSVDRKLNSFGGHSGKSSGDSGVLTREASPEERHSHRDKNDVKAVLTDHILKDDQVLNVSIPSNDRTFATNGDESITASLAGRLDSAQSTPAGSRRFSATLYKHPSVGLGLTLVDGDLHGIKGVYVKSVTDGGPGHLQGGLRIGDRLLAINNQSLDGKNRHDTVTLVGHSGPAVHLAVLRLTNMEDTRSSGRPTGGATTKRQRAVSDFADVLPAFRSEDIVVDVRRRRTNSAEKLSSICPLDTDGRPTRSSASSSSVSSRSSGEFRLPNDTIYGGFDQDDDDDQSTSPIRVAAIGRLAEDENDEEDDDQLFDQVLRPNESANILDWTDHIDIGDTTSVADDQDDQWLKWHVTLSKNEQGSLGLQIAGGSRSRTGVYIKALVASPALICDDIRPGDRLFSVNDIITDGRSHQQVVDMLKQASSPVTLGLGRPQPQSDSDHDLDNLDAMETISVSLEKPPSGSLGLSLAKLTGGLGIYIRVISPGSAADLNGKLRIGDRLWQVILDAFFVLF